MHFFHLEKYNDFTNERRESVMNYSDEWLKTLEYYRANWEKIIYPKTLSRDVSSTYHEFKKVVNSVPFFGPIIKNIYQKTKQKVRMRIHNIRTE